MANQYRQILESDLAELENELTMLQCKCKYLEASAFRAADELDPIKLSESLSAIAAFFADLGSNVRQASSIVQRVSTDCPTR